jgi:serralysin
MSVDKNNSATNDTPNSATPNGVVDDNSIDFFDTSTGEHSTITSDAYTGPVAGLSHEHLYLGSDDVNLSTLQANVFLHSGSGDDALQVNSGDNVLDGGAGSNFLTGGTGTDTFFVDDRGATADVWSTIVGFHSGDNATVWGVTASDFHLDWADGQGAATATGLTGHFTANGQPTASITMAGFQSSDIGSKLTITFGKTSDTPGVAGSVYMNIHAN